MDIYDFILKWKPSRRVLADRMHMHESTFNNKLRIDDKRYRFSADELERLSELLREMAGDGQEVFSQ